MIKYLKRLFKKEKPEPIISYTRRVLIEKHSILEVLKMDDTMINKTICFVQHKEVWRIDLKESDYLLLCDYLKPYPIAIDDIGFYYPGTNIIINRHKTDENYVYWD
jgi:hypothetical protein